MKIDTKILVTGCAGFIGYHLAKHWLDRGFSVYGLDNLNDYYDVTLKNDRLELLVKYKNFEFKKIDIVDSADIDKYFHEIKPNIVLHMAAQAGVRYSLENPKKYIDSNLVGFANILEACKKVEVKHLVFASSSSVYGKNTNYPYRESDKVDAPVSLYGATKKANELMAHAYSHNFNLKSTGIRFFTVYGPWGRPDMSPYLFTTAIKNNKPIKVFNNGLSSRDFTYIDDVVAGVSNFLDLQREELNISYQIFNLGNGNSVNLLDYINSIEKFIGKKAVIKYYPLQNGDIDNTLSDSSKLFELTKTKPSTRLDDGISKYIKWYEDYYKI